MIYNLKIIETETSLEVWKYEKPVVSCYRSSNLKKQHRFEELSGPEKVQSSIRKKKYYRNRQECIKRIVDCNYDDQTCFLTLTQRSSSCIKGDIKTGNYEFDKFIRRLRRFVKKHCSGKLLKYLATWEYYKSGYLHYHLILFLFPYIPTKTIEEIWGHGFIKINKIREIEPHKVGVYISKYFSKDLNMKDAKKKAYFMSRNLKRPEEILLDCSIENLNIEEVFGKSDYKKSYDRFVLGQYGILEASQVSYYSINKK